ncbi:heme-binding protein [Streptomyces sp. NPDC005784]|uniref:heme-binding protein n=1 Tax=Streptomyces sp. NPDC005784 TaxID=3364731 RepID=UPI0036A1F659
MKSDRAIGAAEAKAAEVGVLFTLLAVDAGASLISVACQDGAAWAADETSRVKARTAVLSGRTAQDLAAAVQPGASLTGIEATTRKPLAFRRGWHSGLWRGRHRDRHCRRRGGTRFTTSRLPGHLVRPSNPPTTPSGWGPTESWAGTRASPSPDRPTRAPQGTRSPAHQCLHQH